MIQSISTLIPSEDMVHIRGATVEFIERGVGSRSHVECGFAGIQLVLKNLLVSRWLLFMAGMYQEVVAKVMSESGRMSSMAYIVADFLDA